MVAACSRIGLVENYYPLVVCLLLYSLLPPFFLFFFFNNPAPPKIYPLPLHAALPIPHGVHRLRLSADHAGDDATTLPGANLGRDRLPRVTGWHRRRDGLGHSCRRCRPCRLYRPDRSEEHTSELQSQSNLVCRLLLEKK